MKIRLNELEAIHPYLKELSKLPLSCGYYIAYNLRLVDTIVTAEREVIKNEFLKYCDKDDSGQETRWLRRARQAQTNDESDFVKITPEVLKDTQYQDLSVWEREPVLRMIDEEALKSFKEFEKSAYEHEHEVEFKLIPESKLEESNVAGELIIPLFGTVIASPKLEQTKQS